MDDVFKTSAASREDIDLISFSSWLDIRNNGENYEILAAIVPFWILDCRFWIEERLTGQAFHLGRHSANFISGISKSNGYTFVRIFSIDQRRIFEDGEKAVRAKSSEFWQTLTSGLIG